MPPASAPTETTRKVYVLEITRPVPESEVQKIESTAVNAITESVDTPPLLIPRLPQAHLQRIMPSLRQLQVVIPVVGDEPGTASQPQQHAAVQNGGNLQAQTYTVQKDDTLQKVSKKVFGSYGKWYKIYEANKDKIKNPNVLRAGTVLTIPEIK